MKSFLQSHPGYKAKREAEQTEGYGWVRDESRRRALFRRLQQTMVQRQERAKQRQMAAQDEEL